MNTKQLKESLRFLSEWFRENRRFLPWRENPSVYRVWVSEIMLQQTRVDAVIPYFERFMKKFPTVEALAAAYLDEVLIAWAGLGYYSRARNLHKTAQLVRDAGGFPKDREGWLALPGVGGYTAGAVLSIALNLPEAILDANVKRVIARVFRPDGKAKTEEDKQIFWDLSGKMVRTAYRDGIKPRVINQALMELGALVCLTRTPMCAVCPLSAICLSYRAGDTTFLPFKTGKEWIDVHETVYAVVDPKRRVLLTDRGMKWRKGLWDLPGKLPEEIKKSSLKKHSDYTVLYTVTRHKVTRKILLFRTQNIQTPSGYRLFPLKDLAEPVLALGSSAKKSLALTVDKLKTGRA